IVDGLGDEFAATLSAIEAILSMSLGLVGPKLLQHFVLGVVTLQLVHILFKCIASFAEIS
ncbi:hypothetical protein U1Q18_031331, partial [Sarracenia purpurea var. burkii]